jgi:hypothetical protein
VRAFPFWLMVTSVWGEKDRRSHPPAWCGARYNFPGEVAHLKSCREAIKKPLPRPGDAEEVQSRVSGMHGRTGAPAVSSTHLSPRGTRGRTWHLPLRSYGPPRAGVARVSQGLHPPPFWMRCQKHRFMLPPTCWLATVFHENTLPVQVSPKCLCQEPVKIMSSLTREPGFTRFSWHRLLLGFQLPIL